MKKVILMLAVVSLIAVPSFAKKQAGDVPAPLWAAEPVLPVEVEEVDSVKFDWQDVEEAEKYSLDICGMVLVDGVIEDLDVEDVEVEWCVSFGTSDWNEDMSDSEIIIPLEDLHIAIFAAIDEAIANAGITDAEDTLVEMYAKVKGLDPHAENGKKRQNNEFSTPLNLLPHPPVD